MDFLTNLPFNPKPSTLMHIDLNSCFATIEQQANPLLRGKPVAVAAYTTPSGCIVAPSIEAKRFGIKTGMRVKDGKMLYPDLVVLPPDPWKYRSVHLKLKNMLKRYTDVLVPKSIDEFILSLEGYPSFSKGMINVGEEIKNKIKEEIGEYLTVSIGIAPNRFLAKTGAGLHKPDGLDEINAKNFLDIYSKLKLDDLSGISEKNTIRLNNVGIFTVLDMYYSSPTTLRSAFQSILGNYWHIRLRGYEIDDVEYSRKSFGNSVALGKPLTENNELAPILQKLVEKTSTRMRRAGFKTRGVHVGIMYRDFSFWHHGHSLSNSLIDSRDIYKEIFRVFVSSPYKKPVRELSISCFNLTDKETIQLSLIENVEKKENLYKAVDKINDFWGDYTITPALMLAAGETVKDRVAFGGVKELEEFTLKD